MLNGTPKTLRRSESTCGVPVLNGEDDLAAPLGRKLLALAPHDADFLYLNGVIERTAGDYATARKHLQER